MKGSRRFARGGLVGKPGDTDTIPVCLAPGTHNLTPEQVKAVERLSGVRIDKLMARGGTRPHFTP